MGKEPLPSAGRLPGEGGPGATSPVFSAGPTPALRPFSNTHDLLLRVSVGAQQVHGLHVPKVNVMAQQKDEEQLADVFFFTIAIESLVAYGTGGEGGESGEVLSQNQTAEGAGAAPERQAPATRTAQC